MPTDPVHEPHDDTLPGLAVRSATDADTSVIQTLYGGGLLAGQIAANDTGADIDNLREAFFANPRTHFWVAQLHDDVVGMIGVSDEEQDTAEIRRLRVSPDRQATPIAALLLETAVEFCREQEYLKVRLDTRFEKSAALDLFDRIGFQHTRTKPADQKELLEFYLDLYRPAKDEE